MDYKSLVSDCQLRSEEFRMMHNAEGVVHELQCAKAISDLLEKCKRLDESRERANESAHMWESRCKMMEERAENAERERDAAVVAIYTLIADCPPETCREICANHDGVCAKHAESGHYDHCKGFKWIGEKEE